MSMRAFIPYGVDCVQGPIRPLHAEGPAFPAEATALFIAADDSSVTVSMTVRAVNHRPTLASTSVKSLDVGGLTATDVHELSFDTLFDTAVRAIAASVADARYPGHGDPHTEGEAAVKLRRQRQVMTDELLQQVANVVQGDDLGQPRQAVRRHFNVSERTASRWIALTKRRASAKVNAE